MKIIITLLMLLSLTAPAESFMLIAGHGPSCTATETPETTCDDSIDNDCDGLVDTADSDCAGYEDFSAYTEVDPDGAITISGDTISWVNFSTRKVDRYVSKDFGAGYFNGDFQHQFVFTSTSGAASFYVAIPWAVGTQPDDLTGQTDALALGCGGYTTYIWRLYTMENTSLTYTDSSSSACDEGTTYYVTVTLDWDGGTNSTGLITAEIRTTSHTNETGKVTISRSRGVGEQNSYQYLFGIQSVGNSGSDYLHTGSVTNMDLTP